MSQLTVAGLWGGGRALVERHAATTVPVAAAFIFLPQMVQAVIGGHSNAGPGEIGTGQVLVSLLVLLAAFVGQIAIAAIMLGGPKAPYDVRDALTGAVRLLPRALLVLLLILLILFPLLLILGTILIMAAGGPGSAGDMQAAVRAASWVILPMLALFAYISARLFLLFPVLASEDLPAAASIKRTWGLTRLSRLPLFGFVLSALLAAIFLTMVVSMVAGALLGLLLGAKSTLAMLLVATLSAIVGTAIGLIGTGASVTAYRALERA